MGQEKLYNEAWHNWRDMKVYGPASRYLRLLIKEMIRKKLVFLEVNTVLDVGCGEGTITRMLSDLLPGAELTGIDISSTAIDYASDKLSRNKLKFFKEYVETVRGEFDLVTCFEVLEHVESWEVFLNELMKRTCRYLMLSFPTGRMRKFEVNVGHLRNFRKGSVENFLNREGFTSCGVFYAGFPMYSPLYRELCNVLNSGSSPITTGEYSFFQKTIAEVFFFFFRYLSFRTRGDQFVGLFKRI
ncbi:MAG: class I SAM-dependent methyltransferase [Fibrobacterota bacterium]